MKVLVELRPEDAKGNKFIDCNNCAMARAVKRVLKPNLKVNEGVDEFWFLDVKKDGTRTVVVVDHEEFGEHDFNKLKSLPDGSFMVYEMNIPERFLLERVVKNHEMKKEGIQNATK